ncbi:MAG: YARHG domain-containing protein [Enterocloster bolteae]
MFSRYLSRADLCLWPTEDLWLLRNEIYAANGRQFKSDVLSRYFSEKGGTGESLNRIPFQIPFCRM